MPKSLSLGNGKMLICSDSRGQVRDFYFPYVGLENHIGGHYVHRVGVYADGQLNWFDHSNWNIKTSLAENSLVGEIFAENNALGVSLEFIDTVYNEKNIFLRKAIVTNKSDRARTIKVFFNHEFEIYESHRGDTSYFDPINHAIIHYNGKRVFLINGKSENGSFSDYTTGVFRIEGKEGSFRDAEDGVLSKNLIEHGPTDSVIGFYFDFAPNQSKTFYYWMTAATSIKEALSLNSLVLGKTPEHMIQTTKNYWTAWVNRYDFSFYGLKEKEIALFKKSLLTMRSHVDDNGAIIASADSDMLQGGRDTYSYMWPRDGAFSAMTFDMAGDFGVAERFYDFCARVIDDKGYLMHKYRPDDSLGSSWHPWMRNGAIELPIQEDETALVVIGLWQHYKESKDLEFIERVYDKLVKSPADFMVSYRDSKTLLPKASYDLWEEKFGVHTFTACAVYGALIAAAKISKLLGKTTNEELYFRAAFEIRQGILTYLYDDSTGIFVKMVNIQKDGTLQYDKTLDISSVYGVFAFEVLDIDDDRLTRAIGEIKKRLVVKTDISGVIRYEGDRYFRHTNDNQENPWFIGSLWLAQYYIAKAKKESDFSEVHKWIEWTVRYAGLSGMLSEQLNPHTGTQLSATPLVWSHSEYVITIIKYLDKLEELGICLRCNPLYQSKN